ncbi:hypothetical protein [Shewanella maritima]|uniref:hypothetical protein n=1 Tax=Shewanella maritima TaxID=2520507 RepID=UPI0037358670
MAKPTQHESDDEFTQLQQQVSEQYHQQALEQPSAQLDQAILSQANRHVQLQHDEADISEPSNSNEPNKVVKLSWWKQHKLGLSSAASVVIIAGLFVMNPQEFDDINQMPNELQMTSPESMLMSAPQTTASEPMLMNSSELSKSPEQASSPERIKANSSETSSMPAIRSSQADMPAQSYEDAAQPMVDAAANPLTGSPHAKLKGRSINEIAAHSETRVSLDTAESALTQLTELLKQGETQQAQAYLMHIQQRFPELLQPEHPLHQQYRELSQQFTDY